MTTTTATLTPAYLSTVSGPQLVALYEQILGREPKAKQPAPSMRKQIAAALAEAASSEKAAQAAELDERDGFKAEPTVERDPDAEIDAAHEEAMKAARAAVAEGANEKVCSDIVGSYQSGALTKDEFLGELEAAVASALNAGDKRAVEAAYAKAGREVPANVRKLIDGAFTAGEVSAALRVACSVCGAAASESCRFSGTTSGYLSQPHRERVAMGLARLDAEADEVDELIAESAGPIDRVLASAHAADQDDDEGTPATTEDGELVDASGEHDPAQDVASGEDSAPKAAGGRPGVRAELPPVGARLAKRSRTGEVVAAVEVVEGGVAIVFPAGHEGKVHASLTAAVRALGQKGSGVKYFGLAATPAAAKVAKSAKEPKAPKAKADTARSLLQECHNALANLAATRPHVADLDARIVAFLDK